MFLQRSAAVVARRAAVSPIARRTFVASAIRRKKCPELIALGPVRAATLEMAFLTSHHTIFPTEPSTKLINITRRCKERRASRIQPSEG